LTRDSSTTAPRNSSRPTTQIPACLEASPFDEVQGNPQLLRPGIKARQFAACGAGNPELKRVPFTR